MNRIDRLRNIGISAHIDSGKTTLTERILFYTGRIHAMHEVRGSDGIGAEMDSMDLEREKGITIQSAATYCRWGDHHLNVIDTPGHVDFTIEVERALRVLDGAILVLDSVAGVQSQSITVDRQMKRYGVPRLAFVNKLDRVGGDALRVARMLEEKLGHCALELQMPIGAEAEFEGVIDLVTMRAYRFDGDAGRDVVASEVPPHLAGEALARRALLVEKLSELDDGVAHAYLEGREVPPTQLKVAVRRATLALTATPVLMGSALRNKGVQPLLDAVVDYLPGPADVRTVAFDLDADGREVALSPRPEAPLVALAFKLEETDFGQFTYMRLYQGSVAKGDTIYNCNAGAKKVRVQRIMRMHANKRAEIESAAAGDIVALYGIEATSGDTFTGGDARYTLTSMHVPDAVISLAIRPARTESLPAFSRALNRFTKEDPTLRVHRDEDSGQTILSGMGELHLQVVVERMRREFGCEVESGRPLVAYRETITQRADFDVTHKKQSGGQGQFARVRGHIEPLPPDAVEPFEFVDETVGGSIPRDFIPGIEKGFREAIADGSLIGAPVVGVRAVLTDGAWHEKDSSELSFRLAAVQAFRQAYAIARPTILEPLMNVEVRGPSEFQGPMIAQVNQRRGVITGTRNAGADVVITAQVPLAAMFEYSTDLRSATQGKGEYAMELCRHAPVPRPVYERLMETQRRKDAPR